MLATPLYAAVFALLLFALSFRTLRLRRRYKVAIGASKEPALARAMRVQANFCEYVPLTVLLVFFLETLTATSGWIHALFLILLSGRVLHAYGVSQVEENYGYRVLGMTMTFTVMLTAACSILFIYVTA